MEFEKKISLFRNEFNKFDDTRAQTLDSIYQNDIKITLKSQLCRIYVKIVS